MDKKPYIYLYVLVILSILLASPSNASTIGKLIDADWFQRGFLKTGLVTSFCVAQSATGLTESYRFNGRHIVSDSDYHFYKTVRDVSWIGTGWFIQSYVRSTKFTRWEKVRHIVGAGCWGRNFHEWFYRANRCGDPFNYSDKYTHNKKAIVYFKWDADKGGFVDMYISGTGRKGAFIDIGFWLLGTWLL